MKIVNNSLIRVMMINLFVKIDLWKWLDAPFYEAPPPPENGQMGIISARWINGQGVKIKITGSTPFIK